MVEALIKDQIRGDQEIAGMLTSYMGKPAFFFQKAPSDTDAGWKKPCYPRMDYLVSNRYDPERKVSGSLDINIWCTTESLFTPEDIDRLIVELVHGSFYSDGDGTTMCAVWNRSDSFSTEQNRNAENNTMPEVFGITSLFDLLEFPVQLTSDPDPVQGLNMWTRDNFPDMTVINQNKPPPIWKPSDECPAIYWRFEGMASTDRQSYAVTWYIGQFAAHVVAGSVTGRNQWTKALIERIQRDGEIVLADYSPMFVKNIAVRHGADPLREGQLLMTGQYGVLEQPRKEYTQVPLNNASMRNIRMEVAVHGKVD